MLIYFNLNQITFFKVWETFKKLKFSFWRKKVASFVFVFYELWKTIISLL